jgi:hypothetical protein
MNKQKDISWFRISAEGVVIVASILFAFAIDAWWAERQDRQMERDDLARLHTEFIWNRDQIGIAGDPTRRATASKELYELVLGHLGHDEPLVVERVMVRRVTGTPTFDAVTPVLEGLITSGRLDNIRNREVLSAITYWQRMLKQVEETEMGARVLVDSHLIPALVQRGNMGPAFAEFDFAGDSLVEVDLGGTVLLTVDDELLGHIGNRVRQTVFISRVLDVLKTAANDVIVAIEKNQNK